MRAALYSKAIDNSKVKCTLCPHSCVIPEGSRGKCAVRYVKNGSLQTHTYDALSAMAIDPIEKKPLYHFQPGSSIFSVGSIGCTMQCSYCQNHRISQYRETSLTEHQKMDPGQLFKEYLGAGTRNIAYTYNEPILSIENILELAPLVNGSGGLNIMVSNGYIQEKPLNDLLPHISAFNIDIKASSEDAHRTLTGAKLEPVLQSVRQIKYADKHLELCYLVVPGYNDDSEDFSKLCKWISAKLGKEQVLHISRYFPRYKLQSNVTPLETMEELTAIAKSDLDYVYCGNVNESFDNNTYCPDCRSLLIQRRSYKSEIHMLENENCKSCGKLVPGIFK